MNDLEINLGVDPSELGRGLDRAVGMVNGAASRIRSALDGIGDLGQRLSGLGATMTASLTLPIVGLGKSAIEAYGDIQSLQKGLEAVLGSAERASAEFQRLREVAKLPGLGMEEAVKGSINLQSIGLSAKTSRNILQQFGNAVATVGKGRVEFERAIYGVQQLANTDFPLGEDLNIIKDALPQVSSLLKEAFGTSRSDELKDLGISSKQVLDTIVSGLSKLPRVTGGIKGAFENFSDSMKMSLGRVGKIIDDTFDISGIVDKITGYVDKIITAFEGLNPTVQKVILTVAGLVAAAGPLLLALGGIMAAVPLITSGLGAIGSLFAFLVTPIGLVTVAVVGVVAAFTANWDKIRPYLEENIDRFKRLYNESIVFRTVVGTFAAAFEGAFKSIGVILSTFYDNFKAIGKAILEIFSGVGEAIEGVLTLDFEKVGSGVKRGFSAIGVGIASITKNSVSGFKQLGDIAVDTALKYSRFRFDLSKKTNLGLNLGLGEDTGVDKLIKGLTKKKKEVERQLSEIIPPGSIADYKKRAELLKKSIEYSVDGLVKVRGLDKYGKDIDKKGNPYYTGLILPIEKAYEELEKLQVGAGEIELQPVQIKNKGFLDPLGNEFKTFGELLSSQNIKIATTLDNIGKTVELGTEEVSQKALNAVIALQKLNEDLNNTLNTGISDSIADVFSSIGKSFVDGTNVFKSVGKSLLSSFGGILSELGKQMIQYGVSLLAIKASLKSLNPYVAIAAGIALVALGSGLTSSIQNQSNSIGGSGGVSSSAGASTPSYSSGYSSGGGLQGGEYVFRLSGPDLIAVFNRNVQAGDRVSAG